MRLFICLSLIAAVFAGRAEKRDQPNPIHFVGIETLAGFERSVRTGATVLTSPWYTSLGPWTELVASWNVACPPGGHLKVEARAARRDVTTPFYTLGLWSGDPARHPRESVTGQKDSWAEVKTDTLVCRTPMERVQFRLTLGGDGALPRVKFIGFFTHDTGAAPMKLPPNRAAWGREIRVPQRSQLGHSGAAGWCSPACVSMILAHWAKELRRPELDVTVPEVAQGVHDRNWPGTGNWPFNTAFAGQYEGLRAYVARFGDLREIEDWVAAGVPVAASVSFDLLNGKAVDEGNGHLVVVAGFTKTGDVVVNDPWPNPRKENSVRKVFPRPVFLRAWQRSNRTVYLIYPLSMKVPANRETF